MIRGIKSKGFLISVLLMMVCVQTFSMHFHITHDGDQHHEHLAAHSHATDNTLAHHTGVGHEDDAGVDILGTLIKQSISFDFLIFVLILFVPVNLARSNNWQIISKPFEWRYLLFFRPPLRAPPV